MEERLRHSAAVCTVCLGGLLICFLAGCVDAPHYYWAKFGITQAQIHKDNMFCADMTAEKPSTYARGSTAYYAPLDQAAYQECMQSLGYRKVTEEELKRGQFVSTPRPFSRSDPTRELCQRVTGSAGDVEACIRYMSMDVIPKFPLGQFEDHDSSEPSNPTASQIEDACIRKDPNDTSGFTMIVSRRC